MPRQARLDAPGTLHHVIARGIERREIFVGQGDYDDFVARLERACALDRTEVLAWALLPNHFHLLIRTRELPLSRAMRRLMTGYSVNFNKRYGRSGHLFQNRYKSIVCEEEAYLMELVRYIHLNPLRARVVGSLQQLASFPYCGHSGLMGKVDRYWQNTSDVLGRFGRTVSEAREKYQEFVAAGVAAGRRPEFVGGGLERSAGGWSEVLAARGRKARIAYDRRVLGSSEFVLSMLGEAESGREEGIRIIANRPTLEELCERLAEGAGVEMGELRTGSRRRRVVAARGELSDLAVRKYGYAAAEVARYLGVSTSCVTRVVERSERLQRTDHSSRERREAFSSGRPL
jgi:putative transposase